MKHDIEEIQKEFREGIKKEVLKIFHDYLDKNGQRKTPERDAVLKVIYNKKIHYDADSIYMMVRAANKRCSKATIYNTLELLTACGLVVKHQFGTTLAQYEQAYGNKQHDHLVCKVCSRVTEFCDPRLSQTEKMIGELLDFDISDHSLNLYGYPKLDAKGFCPVCSNLVEKVNIVKD